MRTTRQRLDVIRAIEAEVGRPIGVLLDLQGPSCASERSPAAPCRSSEGSTFRLDLERDKPGDATRVSLPHPEIFAALAEGAELLIDDGRLRLKVETLGADFAETRVMNGGMLSDRKGVNVPGVVLPLSALTQKDRADLDYGLTLGVDWIALSFVQRAEDIVEVKNIVQGRAGIVAKIEKPAAIDCLDAILAETDAVMVARGDLGVEMPAEHVPALQKRIVRACRRLGKPVIVATQMLESMVSAPVPDARRGVRRGDGHLRRRGRGHVVGRIGIGQVPGGSRRDDGSHRRADRRRPAVPRGAWMPRTRAPAPTRPTRSAGRHARWPGCSTWRRWWPTRVPARRPCAWRASGLGLRSSA